MKWDESNVCEVHIAGIVDAFDESGEKIKCIMSIEYHPYFMMVTNFYRLDNNGDVELFINYMSVNLDCQFITMESGKIKMRYNDIVVLLTQKQVDDIQSFFNRVEEND